MGGGRKENGRRGREIGGGCVSLMEWGGCMIREEGGYDKGIRNQDLIVATYNGPFTNKILLKKHQLVQFTK